ncbi:hypothetical protein [Roseobacter ponti]|uniref:Uncharacterized protein n=1 Tax=Roseobacter ponti TaxID=1891787 RepID=A0A858SYP1_9RHOB|nr:hypothetical protein [Roseobacter ponti]QJF51976.1 hypothetical protein G3256_12785 [Roseobacter ponti]
MFSPEGYWSWDEIVTASAQWTRDLIIAKNCPSLLSEKEASSNWETERKIQDILVEDGFVETASHVRFAVDVAHLWLLANFLDVHDAVLCSPEGVRMRCPPIMKAHGDALDWWSWPLSSKPFGRAETWAYLNYFTKGNFRITDAQSRFCAIDYLSGTIQLKPNSKNLLLGSSYGHGCEEIYVEKFIDVQLRPVLGWAVCWNPSDLPETESEIFQSLGFSDLDWNAIDFDGGNLTASPPHQQNILDCILAVFPEGKQGATWAVVESKVGYSRRSIVRALKQNNLWSDWSESGQENKG